MRNKRKEDAYDNKKENDYAAEKRVENNSSCIGNNGNGCDWVSGRNYYERSEMLQIKKGTRTG